MTYQLRQYQTDLISRIAEAWYAQGNRRVMAQMPTGSGKTIVLSSIVDEFVKQNLRCLVLAHRTELINQAVEKLENVVNEPCGVIKSGIRADYTRLVQVGSVQSMKSRLGKLPEFDLIVIDECFPAGSQVDGKPIESLRVGNYVNSFNEITGKTERKPIVRLFKKLSSSKVFVVVNGIKIECTEEHSFYTKRGWIAANQLTTEDYLYVNSLQRMRRVPESVCSSNKMANDNEKTFDNCEERARFEENRALEWIGVESVEVYQQASDGGLGKRFVYNIEVLDNHNYFVEGVLVHNCHHTTLTGSYGAVLDYYPNAKVLGVTATPIRLDGKGFRGVFDDLICGVSTSDLIEMGSLSQYKLFACEKPMSVLGLKKRGGDFKQEEIEQQNPIEVVANQVYESYNRNLKGKQAVIFATSVAHSIAITEHLRSTGIAAHHLDGMSPTDERQSAMDLFRNREIQILSNCSLFDEGLDIPSIDGVILARPTASLSRYLQMVGRGLRPCEGKERAVIIDLADNYERHGMPDDDRDWTLDGIPKKPKERKTSTRERNVITDEVETISLFDTGTEYIEIAGKTVLLTDELREWMRLADAIIAEGIEREFKSGWAAHKLLEAESQPPIEAWKYLGKKLGYHHAWAKYKHEEWAAK